MEVVKLERPTHADEIAESLERLLNRVNDGEFETVYIIAVAPSGSWTTKEVGKKSDRLRLVGLLESLKADVLIATETDEPSGL